MKLTIFKAGKGDCLLLAHAGTHVLVDGGMRDAYQEHVAPALGELAEAKEKLDLIYLSHIDRDHISGVLQLMEDTVAWRVFDFQRKQKNTGFPEPPRPRPPAVRNLWHNAFHEEVGANAGDMEDLLATKGAILETGRTRGLRRAAFVHRELATSIGEGVELTRRVGPEQLRIPVNHHFGGKLAFVQDGQRPIRIGRLKLTLIGPSRDDLDALRKDWNRWLNDNKDELERIRARVRRDSDRLGTSEIARLRTPLELAAAELGDRKRVTVPNLASLMLLAEADGRSVLLTGDGHAREILRGLEHAGRVAPGGGMHVDVLKVQHHGSEYNLDPDFARRVTAERYVFCANGEHDNPDPRIVELIINSRLGSASQRSRNPEASRPFELLFNYSSTSTGIDERPHLRKVERLVDNASGRSNGAMRFFFADGPSFDIDL